MTVKDAAKKWGYTEAFVRTLCMDEVVSAEKIKHSMFKKREVWDIPEDHIKPPHMTRFRLCKMLKTAIEVRRGANIEGLNWGFPNELVIEAFNYLHACGFITAFDENNFDKSITEIRLTSFGEILIKKDEECRELQKAKKEAKKNKIYFGADAEFNVNFNEFVNLKIGANVKNYKKD